MAYRNKGSMATTVTVSLEPDRSGNFVCDGAADDVQIQAAIDYVNTLGGGTIYIKSGTYVITNTIISYSNIEIYGDGMDVTILNTSDNTDALHVNVGGANEYGGSIEKIKILLEGTATGIIVDNTWLFKINKVKISPKTDNYDISIQILNSSHHVYITNSRLTLFNNYGIDVEDGNGGFIENNDLAGEDGSVGIYIKPDGWSIVNNWMEYVSPNGGTHIKLDSADWTYINGNKLHGQYKAGEYIIHLLNTSRRNIISGNEIAIANGGGVYIADLNSHSTIIDDNTFQLSTSAVRAIQTMSPGNIISNNKIYVTAQSGSGTIKIDRSQQIINGNYIEMGGVINQIGIDVAVDVAATECIITDNIIKGTGTAVSIRLAGASSYCLVKDNILDETVTDTGTNNKFTTVKGDFTQYGGGSAGWTAPVINTSPGGIDIDANDEFAYAHIILPQEVQHVIRIKYWAYSNVIEATNNMLLQLNAHGATSSEAWSGNAIDVVNHPSEETGGIVVGDVIHWLIDASDDAQIGTLAAQDLVELMAVGEGASAPDIATDALFGGWEIEYV